MAGSPAPHDRLDALAAEARYRRERLELYRAKMYGQRPTSQKRLRELERASRSADARLQVARRAAAAPEGDGSV